MKANKTIFFSEMLEKNKRVFKVPVYQRNYDWSRVQCEKIYKDIALASQKQIQHFIGTIVYLNDDYVGSGLNTVLIIDGQQRLTTLYILLKALLDFAKTTKDKEVEKEINDVIFNKNCTDQNKIKLKAIETDDDQLVFLFNNEIDKMDYSSNIYQTYTNFKQLIQKSLNDNFGLANILEGVKRLELVEIILEKSEGDQPQKIFESINSTGLELSLSDLIRNYLLMDEKNQDIFYKKYWQDIEKNVSYKNLVDFILHYINSIVNKPVNNKNAYQLFKDNCEKNNLSNEDVLIDLRQKSKYFSAFIGKNNFYDKDIQYYLDSFYVIKQGSVVPFLFNVLDDYENNKINKQTLIKVLSYVLSYNIRLVVVENTKNLNKQMQNLHSRAINNNFDNYYEKFVHFLNNLKSSEKMPKDEEFRTALIYKQIYKKNVCKFLLASIENSSKEKLDFSILNIEHILPQKENALVWKKELGDEYQGIYETLLHTIGNLTITGYNSELGIKSFKEKQKIIQENSKAKILNQDILNVGEWNYKNIIKRAENLSEILIKKFNYENIVFDHKKNLINYNLMQEVDYSYTKPIGFMFETVFIKTKSWSELLIKFINELYDLNREWFINFSKNNDSTDKTKSIYISNDKSKFIKSREIKDTKIYFEINLSSNNIVFFIKNLLKKMDYNLEGFLIYLDDNKNH